VIATTTPTRTLPDLSVAELSAWLRQHDFNAVHAPRVIRGLLAAQEPKSRADFLLPEALETRLRADFADQAAILGSSGKLVRRRWDDGKGGG